MSLSTWFLAGSNVKNDQLPPKKYKILKGFKGTFSTLNPGNSGVPYNYLGGWDSAAASTSSSSAGGGFWTPDANNVQNFLSDCLGYAYIAGSVGSYTIKRILPDSLYDWPLFYAQSAAMEGWGDPREGQTTYEITYPAARIVVDYKPLPFSVLDDSELSGTTGQELERFVTRGYGFDGQYLTVNGQMKFCTNPQNILQTQPGKIVPSQELNYTWHLVPALASNPFIPPNMTAIMNCLGKVNSKAFDTVAGINAPPGTILFTSADVKMELPSLGGSDAAGSLVQGGLYYWTITIKISYKFNGYYSAPGATHGSNNTFPGWGGNTQLDGVAIGHNWIYRTYGETGSGANATTGGFSLNLPFWDLVTSNGGFTVTAGTPPTVDGRTIYQSGDLNTLFTITG